MKFPIRVDMTKGEIRFFDADDELVTPEELVKAANALDAEVDNLRAELRDE
jgi:hypothetical protein